MTKQEGFDYFIGEVESTLKIISMDMKKADIVAHIRHIQVLIENIKYINNEE